MLVRQIQLQDLPEINELYQAYADEYDLPLNEAIISVIAEEDGKIIGAGIVRMIPETILVLDKNARDRDKINALRQILRTGAEQASEMGLYQLHAFVENEKFAEVLKKHFFFKECKGAALVQEI